MQAGIGTGGASETVLPDGSVAVDATVFTPCGNATDEKVATPVGVPGMKTGPNMVVPPLVTVRVTVAVEEFRATLVV